MFKQFNLISRLFAKLTLHNFKQIWQQYPGRKTAVCPCPLTLYANICWFTSLQSLPDVLVCFVMKSASFAFFFRFVFLCKISSLDMQELLRSDKLPCFAHLHFFCKPNLELILYLIRELLVCLCGCLFKLWAPLTCKTLIDRDYFFNVFAIKWLTSLSGQD